MATPTPQPTSTFSTTQSTSTSVLLNQPVFSVLLNPWPQLPELQVTLPGGNEVWYGPISKNLEKRMLPVIFVD